MHIQQSCVQIVISKQGCCRANRKKIAQELLQSQWTNHVTQYKEVSLPIQIKFPICQSRNPASATPEPGVRGSRHYMSVNSQSADLYAFKIPEFVFDLWHTCLHQCGTDYRGNQLIIYNHLQWEQFLLGSLFLGMVNIQYIYLNSQ